jgi:hypothetical protein
MLRSRSHEAGYFQSRGSTSYSSKPNYHVSDARKHSHKLAQYIPASGPFIPIAKLVIPFPALAYQIFFEDHTAAATVELGKNITRTTRATLRTVDSPPPAAFLKSKNSYLSGWNDVDIVRNDD